MVKLAIAELTFKPQRHPLNKDATFLCEQESLCSDAAAFPMSLIVGLGRRRQTPGRPMESTARQQQQQCPGQAHSRRPGGGSGGGPSGGRGGICPAAHPRSAVLGAVSGCYAPSSSLSVSVLPAYPIPPQPEPLLPPPASLLRNRPSPHLVQGPSLDLPQFPSFSHGPSDVT